MLVRVFNNTILIWPSHKHAATTCRFIVIQGGLSHKPGGFLRSPRQIDAVNFICNIEIQQIYIVDDDE